MTIRHCTRGAPDKVEQQMTPMIDIVFQLLTFFILSFKLAAVEGDFNLRLPQTGISALQPGPNLVPPIRVRLSARPSGDLAAIHMGPRQLPDFAALHNEIVSIVADPHGATNDLELQLEADSHLHYRHVIDAVTAASGRNDADGRVIRLIEKITLATSRSAGA